MKRKLWLAALDVAFHTFGFGSPVYLWVLRRATGAVDWSVES